MLSLARYFNVTRCSVRCSSSTVPWFVNVNVDDNVPKSLPRLKRPTLPVPPDAPQPLKDVHAHLQLSPFLDASTLLITRPIPGLPGPELPAFRPPTGRRRKRGGTYAGESMFDVPGGLWSWLLFAQVKEGTEEKGTVESVVRAVRKSLLSIKPPLPIPANSRRRMHNGWALIDAGDFAIHVMSKDVREKYFSHLPKLSESN